MIIPAAIFKMRAKHTDIESDLWPHDEGWD